MADQDRTDDRNNRPSQNDPNTPDRDRQQDQNTDDADRRRETQPGRDSDDMDRDDRDRDSDMNEQTDGQNAEEG